MTHHTLLPIEVQMKLREASRPGQAHHLDVLIKRIKKVYPKHFYTAAEARERVRLDVEKRRADALKREHTLLES